VVPGKLLQQVLLLLLEERLHVTQLGLFSYTMLLSSTAGEAAHV
jgi:hypothetical protein